MNQHSQNPQACDLIVVGGGVLGTFHAYHALNRGLRVVLLERNNRPNGATVRNFGQVVPSGMDRQWQRLGRESLHVYKQIQSEFDITVRQCGSTYIASNAEELSLLEELRKINAEEGYASELWSRETCLEKFDSLNAAYAVGALHFPEEVSVDPRQMVHRLQQALNQSELFDIRYGSNVIELESDNMGVRALTSDKQEIRAEKAVVCCGNEFRSLFPHLFSDSDIQDVKLQMLRLGPQPTKLSGNILTGLSIRRYESFSECPSYQSIKAAEQRESDTQRWGIHILFKQETDGSVIVGDSHEYASVNEPELSYEISTEINNCILDQARQILNLPCWNVESQWSGRYCQTKEKRGIFLRTLGEHIHIATAIGGKGMTASAGFAKQHLKEIYGD